MPLVNKMLRLKLLHYCLSLDDEPTRNFIKNGGREIFSFVLTWNNFSTKMFNQLLHVWFEATFEIVLKLAVNMSVRD